MTGSSNFLTRAHQTSVGGFAALILIVLLPTTAAAESNINTVSQAESTQATTVVFAPHEDRPLSEEEKVAIHETLEVTYAMAREVLPGLVDHVTVTVHMVDRDLSNVGGASGRADAPGEITLEISMQMDGGISTVIDGGLASTFAHELHHLVRGWTISGNRFGPGISIAAINEGMAVVFAEELTGKSYPGNQPPSETDAEAWAIEILALPRRVNYGEWMFAHPDGRESVGYRIGHFVVRRAMATTGQDIIELSSASPDEIWAYAGF